MSVVIFTRTVLTPDWDLSDCQTKDIYLNKGLEHVCSIVRVIRESEDSAIEFQMIYLFVSLLQHLDGHLFLDANE